MLEEVLASSAVAGFVAGLLKRAVLVCRLRALHVGGLKDRAGKWIDLRHYMSNRPDLPVFIEKPRPV